MGKYKKKELLEKTKDFIVEYDFLKFQAKVQNLKNDQFHIDGQPVWDRLI